MSLKHHERHILLSVKADNVSFPLPLFSFFFLLFLFVFFFLFFFCFVLSLSPVSCLLVPLRAEQTKEQSI